MQDFQSDFYSKEVNGVVRHCKPKTSTTTIASTTTDTSSTFVHFNETFSDGNGFWNRWVQPPEWTEGTVQVAADGLQTMTDDAYYNLHSNFTPFSSINKTLTLQYTLKTTQTFTCSDNYLEVYSNNTDRVFWFGPVTCDGYSRIILGFSNNGDAYKINKTIDPGYILNTAVAYKLVVLPDGTYSVHINNAVVANGSLANHFVNRNDNHPIGPGAFQYPYIDAIGLSIYQIEAGSIFDDILLTTS
jgi:hypothetical protein